MRGKIVLTEASLLRLPSAREETTPASGKTGALRPTASRKTPSAVVLVYSSLRLLAVSGPLWRVLTRVGALACLPPYSCLQLQSARKGHVKRRVCHTKNEFGPCKSPGASLLRHVGRARRQPRRKHPMGPQKSTSAASQGATAAEDATDAASSTPTRRRQPVLARGCSSPRVGARSTPRRPERDRGRASPGQYLGDGVPLARNWRPQRPRQRGPSADRLDCACLWAGGPSAGRGPRY